jgi:signal transduction histidine kinase
MSAAHELKTPLAVMLGYADLLRSGRLGGLNDRQQEALGELYQSGERLQRLTQDLLLLYQLRAAPAALPRREIEIAPVNPHVQEIFEFWALLARQRSIAYRFQPGPGAPRARVDPSKMQHIVSNLIENALKYSPVGGRIGVNVASCFWERRRAQTAVLFNLERKTSRKMSNAVRIDVTDTGPGIPSDHHEDIFRDFVQVPGTSSQGTGLGLAIARRLTEACGGALWVESEPGRGSRFSLLLAQAGRETRNECAEHTARR